MPALLSDLRRRVVLLDGAMGTMLLDRGLPLGTPPERWVLERPDEVLAVHRRYVAAGAEVLTTCTFGGTAPNLARAGLSQHRHAIWSAAVELAREAIGAAGWVLGDLGPIWPPLGEPRAPDEAERRAAYAEEAAALAAAGCDALLVETMTDLDEAVLAISTIRDVTPCPVLSTLAFLPATAERAAIDPRLAAHRLARAGAAAVGANCMLDAREMLETIVGLVAATDLPVIARPNGGQPRRDDAGRFVYDETPERFAAGVARLVAVGANAVGGCCGTTPAFIAAAAAALGGR
ncbi:MAG: homocysteine S-methyltransferase family protein [Deltaproteobacteria bacterium]|nr:homocysteine S-methyltransferase family protein [Deltaproteobacteria bacterium]